MNIPAAMPRLKDFRFLREIISYAVWAYHRFALSTADVGVCSGSIHSFRIGLGCRRIVVVKSTAHSRPTCAPIAAQVLPGAAPGPFPCTAVSLDNRKVMDTDVHTDISGRDSVPRVIMGRHP